MLKPVTGKDKNPTLAFSVTPLYLDFLKSNASKDFSGLYVHDAGITPLGTAQSGADAEIYLAISNDLESITGKYFNVTKEARAHAQAYDADVRKKLREITLALTGLDEKVNT